jgi:hypothetical protein
MFICILWLMYMISFIISVLLGNRKLNDSSWLEILNQLLKL